MSAQEQIGKRYAQSLFNQAALTQSVDEVHGAMNTIGGLIASLAPLSDFIHNPLIDGAERHKVLAAVFSGKVPDLVMKFLLFVSFKNRLNFLETIIESFDDIYLKAQHSVRARIVTALDIGDDEKKHVLQVLGQKYQKSIVAQWELNPSLIGGFKIFIEGKLHDSSFTSQLEIYKQKVIL